MQTHTTMGAEILAGIPDLHPIIPIVRQPPRAVGRDRLPGPAGGEDDIPLLARIVAVADAFDAMTVEPAVPREPEGQAAGGGVRRGGEAGRPAVRPAVRRGVPGDPRDQVVRTMVELMPDAAQATHASAAAATLVGVNTPPPASFDSAISSEHPII